MRKNLKLASSVIAVFVASTMLLGGCGSKATKNDLGTSTTSPTAQAGPDISKKVTLKFYTADAAKTDDFDLVVTELNKLLEKKINATLNVENLVGNEKYNLVLASGEEFDGIFSASWKDYSPNAQKNAFKEITNDMLSKYAPNTLKNTPKSDWENIKINGKIFMIPQNIASYGNRLIVVRGDLREKYKIAPIKSMNDLDAYLDAVYKNEKGMIPFDCRDSELPFMSEVYRDAIGTTGIEPAALHLVYEVKDPKNYTLKSMFEIPQFIEGLKKIRSWNEKGYISKSALTNKTVDQSNSFSNGKSALFVQNMDAGNSLYNNTVIAHPEWKLELIDTTAGSSVLPYAPINGGFSMSVNTKNADRFLMFVDYVRNDKEANFLMQRGIKGKHWDASPGQSDENITIPGPDAKKYNGSFTWGGARNIQFQVMPDPKKSIPGFTELFKDLQKRTVPHPLMNFSFDQTNVKNELAALTSVKATYWNAVTAGYVEPVAGIAEYKEKLKAAGYDKVYAEFKKQFDAYTAALK